MSLPGNGIFVVQGEMAMLVTAMRRSTRWGSHSFPNDEYDVLMRTFQDLKTILNQVDDLRLLDPSTYLSPFLEVIRSKETTGPVTSLALSSIHKFLSYGLIDPTHPSVPATVEDIADAVTHARFVGTDHSSDGVVLLKILQVLRTLMLSPEGAMLTDESVCEIMLSCFRTCFETRLTELLRRNAEQCLRDMTQLIFMRLPQFPTEDSASTFSTFGFSLKRRDKSTKKKITATHSTNSLDRKSSITEQALATVDSEADSDTKPQSVIQTHNQDKNLLNEAEITIEPVEEVKSPTKKHGRHSSMDLAANENKSITQLLEKCVSNVDTHDAPDENKTQEENTEIVEEPEQPTESTPTVVKEEAQSEGEKLEEYVNHRGIRFTPQDETLQLQPYGLACVRELFRFLISLCNPLDAQNTSAMVHLGLSLVGTALEVGADQIAKYPSLLYLVQDPLCRNLLSLLDTEKITIFALDLQIWFLLFEALRLHLKYQMEAFFKKIIEIVSADTTKSIYELKEIHHIALENLAQMFRIPGLCTELYLNFDCDVYCTNVFEELAKLLSKNVVSSTAYNIHTMSLEALMTIIEAIEMGTMQKVEIETSNVEEEERKEKEKERDSCRGGHVSLELGGMDDVSVVSDHVTHDISQYFSCGRVGRHKAPLDLPTEAELDNVRNMKKWVTQGTDLFNQKPERGIEFLQEHGILSTPLDPHKVALFLRENPDLDKKMIGEYICKRSSREEDGGPSILGAFADSFDYAGLRIDQALRLYLETFRLPGEAPLISLVMEKFAERWHSTNGEPFANTDAAFRLAYAVIMLNVDQHNHNAKKLNVPMTVEDFVRNLRGCNGAEDFEQAMLEAIFHSIKEKEMVMPAERVGPLRDAYLWRVLQRRGRTASAKYRLAPPPPHALHARLLPVACPPAVTALSASFERSSAPTPEDIESNNLRDCAALIALNGLERCAALVARLSSDTLTLDTLLLTLCKFTGLLTPQHASYIAIGVSLGQSSKAQVSLRRACAVAARHADCVRDSWRHLLEILNTLYIGRLLPKVLVEAEDYLSPEGKVSLIREATRGDSGLLSSIYSYIALGESGIRAPTPHEKSLIDTAIECVAKCNFPGLLITETKFLQLESLQELIRAMVAVGIPPDTDSIQLNPQLEDITIFFLELLGQTLIQNRDRVETVWPDVGPHIERIVFWAGSCNSHALTRVLTALLRTSARLMRCEQCAPLLLRYLTLLYRLPYKLFYQQADVISSGLYELVKTSAQNVHSASEWGVLLALLAAAGAGAWPRGAPATAYTAGSSRSEGSEDDSERQPTSVSSESELSHSPQTQGWILVKNETASATETVELELEQVSLRPHRSTALARCVEALALVIRDVAHVTPHNCRAAVRCVRLMAKATLQSGRNAVRKDDRRGGSRRRARGDSSDEEIDTQDHYHVVSIKLLDLMHTLHSRTAQIFKWWRDEADQGQGAEDYDLWEVAWKPLLQGIAEFCSDNRGKKGSSSAISYSAIAYLQRALLAPALSALGGAGWEACFEHVLLPLLNNPPRRPDAAARADTVMCKVFLQHLPALVGRASFASLWARIVRVQRALLASPAEPLREAALESLKNMLLVMHSVKIFSNAEGYNDLWYITWDIIAEFLPTLKEELFPDANDNAKPLQNVPSHMQPSIPPIPAILPVAANNTPNPSTSPPIDTNSQPQRSNAQSPNILLATVAHSPINLPQSPSIPGPPLISPVPGVPAHISTGVVTPMSVANTPMPGPITSIQNSIAYPLIPPMSGQTIGVPAGVITPMPIQPGIKSIGPSLISPIGKPGTGVNATPVSGMVPIRNPLYDQTGLTSSVLLQPLNEMISTPIGISIQSQPVLQPTASQTQPPSENEPNLIDIESTPVSIKDEIYSEYITNPYNEVTELSSKEATLYDPEENRYVPANDQTVQDRLLNQKSFSANVTPMHTKNKAQFGSTDNVRQEGIFNFSSYFGSNEKVAPGSDVFDALMSTQEG
ncbi:Golgi-specific brefeldin A-resistance guanine nucleotide exchange factor 1 isoform X2 [Maniola jurtina]|uniref:Golgi-specific brefeldin A-resistance guanine nucleotide exchange factor 1 isoform X2 n=1 Tax=Maniola jurtina TaxID=191418 RepID=UPI001E687C4F|nr:Golgi-specific brefeldin A-resistance guanine nucleotide exchange factor 1 isoform X2 [Maniola jurtina]